MSKNTTHQGFTLIELLVVIAIIAILAAILFPVFARAREKARQTTCISNQRQITASLMIYVQDHDETLPTTSAVWQGLSVDPNVLVCPTAGKSITNGYLFNGFLGGVGIGTIDNPSSCVVFADGTAPGNIATDNSQADRRHSGKVVTACLDGHVETLLTPLFNLPTYAATNYSLLQMPNEYITTKVGSSTGTGGNGNGVPSAYRWGDINAVWIPNGALTANGGADYWGALIFNRTFNVSSVKLQLWCNEGTSVRKVSIQGSSDGVGWGDIGSKDWGSLQTGNPTVDIPCSGSGLLGIRFYFKTGEYTYGNVNRGGPGVITFEPIGTNKFYDDEINFANTPTFTTVPTCSTFDVGSSTAFTNGLMYDSNPRTGPTGNLWATDKYCQIDLGKPRNINRATVAWDYCWGSSGYNVKYSTDGTTWTAVPNKSAITQFSSNSANQYTFNTTTARYWRITDCAGSSYALLTQIMLHGPKATLP